MKLVNYNISKSQPIFSPTLPFFFSSFSFQHFHTFASFCFLSPSGARGNQRDRDRERAQSRTGAKGKQKGDGLTPEQRRERDAKALQEKAAKKAGQDAGGNNAGGSKK
uniref:Small EDRK-rich factor-like N-terminal domain-containing protein n=1 Tax=Phaseolus vulgaris TaxID=3885 RepID=V7B4W9_PHAVU|nr:hypothetical protein PHAVU_008G127600g [Phaseolus vulgaris]ESW12615.1 hypothetical protein PHAVU_008G127600g [Phaseolus vulgaris]